MAYGMCFISFGLPVIKSCTVQFKIGHAILLNFQQVIRKKYKHVSFRRELMTITLDFVS